MTAAMPEWRFSVCPGCGKKKMRSASRCKACFRAESAKIAAASHQKNGNGLGRFAVRPRIDVNNIGALRDIGEVDAMRRDRRGGENRKPPAFRWAWRDDDPEVPLVP